MYTPTAEALQQRDQTDRTSCESWETTYSASDIAHMDFVSTKPGAPQSPLSHCSTFTRSQSEPVTSFLPQYAHIDAGTLQSMASLTLETSQFAMSGDHQSMGWGGRPLQSSPHQGRMQNGPTGRQPVTDQFATMGSHASIHQPFGAYPPPGAFHGPSKSAPPHPHPHAHMHGVNHNGGGGGRHGQQQRGRQQQQQHAGNGSPHHYQNNGNRGRNNGCGHGVANAANDPRGAKGHAYRRLWQQVTAVNRGGRLGEGDQAGYGEATVEDLLEVVRHLPPEASAIKAVAQGLYCLDSGALAALLKELNKAGHARRAQEIFDWLRGLESSHDLYALCNTMTYTTMISQCGTQQALRRALELVAEMRGRGVQCNVHTYSALMNVCIKANELDLALDVYRQMLAEGCSPNLVTYNTLIDVYGKTGAWEEAMAVLDALQGQGIEPEVRTYNTVIIACNQSSRATEALLVYERMLAAGAHPTATTYTALISAYGKAGQLDSALQIFQDMVRRGCERNVITYSSLISACEKAGRWELALELFREMHTEGCRPNVVTYNSLIAACAQGAQWEKAQEMFEQMQRKGCRPDSVTFGGLIAAYDRAGQWRRALTAFEQMRSLNCRPDTVVYNTVVGALWKTGLLWCQARATQIFQAACRQGHFRLTVHTLGAGNAAATGAGTGTGGGGSSLAASASGPPSPNSSMGLDSFITSSGSGSLFTGQTSLTLSDLASLTGSRAATPALSDVASSSMALACRSPSPVPSSGSPISPQLLSSSSSLPLPAGSTTTSTNTNSAIASIADPASMSSPSTTAGGNDGAQTIEFGMHAFTVGSAVLSLLRWVVELRDRLPRDPSRIDPRQSVALVLNKGKPSREHTYPAIRAALTSMLSAWASPFSLADVPQGCRIEASASDVVDWLRTPAADRALASFVARSAESPRGIHRDAIFQEDALVEGRCAEAFAAVRSFEAVCRLPLATTTGEAKEMTSSVSSSSSTTTTAGGNGEKGGNGTAGTNASETATINLFASQKREWFRTAAVLAAAFGYSDEALHDGFLLADRAMAAAGGGALGVSVTALLVACLSIAAQQAGERTAALAKDPAAEAAAGLQPGEADAAVGVVRSLLAGDTSSISALRVLKLFLERLGADFAGRHETLGLSAGTALELLPGAACDEVLRKEHPSTVAAAVLLAGRRAAGLSPFWPTALAALTGLQDEEGSALAAAAGRASSVLVSSPSMHV